MPKKRDRSQLKRELPNGADLVNKARAALGLSDDEVLEVMLDEIQRGSTYSGAVASHHRRRYYFPPEEESPLGDQDQ